MDKEFFDRKIKELTDDDLIDLLQKTSNKHNPDIFDLAKKEAELRKLHFELTISINNQPIDRNSNDLEKLKKWNWGAFLLAPIWTLANKLEKWTILYFIPGVNIFVIFYLGKNGNRLAFEESTIESVDDFMIIQKDWGQRSVRLLWLGLLGSLIVQIIKLITD